MEVVSERDLPLYTWMETLGKGGCERWGARDQTTAKGCLTSLDCSRLRTCLAPQTQTR